MPGLTMTEKQHWKDRIAARIARRIEAVRARHPALFERVQRQARAQALESLGLTAPFTELEAVHAEEAALARRKKRAQRTLVAALRGVPPDEVGDGFSVTYGAALPLPQEVAEALNRRQSAHQQELLAADPVGGEIARLEAERDRLLDVVWLAVSPAQIKQLWTTVAELLGDEPTPLERAALALAPSKEET